MALADDFVALTQRQRCRVLAWIVHDETVNARAAYYDKDWAGVIDVVERIHRLSAAIGEQSETADGRWALELVLAANSVRTDRLSAMINGERSDG